MGGAFPSTCSEMDLCLDRAFGLVDTASVFSGRLLPHAKIEPTETYLRQLGARSLLGRFQCAATAKGPARTARVGAE
jgi:hypothetical protein